MITSLQLQTLQQHYASGSHRCLVPCGYVSDGEVFHNSSPATAIKRNGFNIPTLAEIEGTTMALPYTFFTDDAFALNVNNTKPYGIKTLTKAQHNYLQLQTYRYLIYFTKLHHLLEQRTPSVEISTQGDHSQTLRNSLTFAGFPGFQDKWSPCLQHVFPSRR